LKKLFKLLLIREDEKATVFYFLSFFFIVGCGLAMGKASAEALFFKRYGIEHLPVIYFALGIMLALVSVVYASFADRMSAEKFYLRIFLAFSVLLLLTWTAMNQLNSSLAYPIYFLLYEAFSEILLIHSALYLSQNLDSFKSKRLSPVIFSGSQLGLIFGGIIVALLAPVIGTNNIVLLWCVLLVLSMLMLVIHHKIKGPSAYYFSQISTLSVSQSINTIKQGIYFTRHSALLRAASLAFFFLVIAFYTLHFITNQIYNDYFTNEKHLTAFFGALTAVTGLLGILIQVFITNRAIKKIGLQKLNLAFPTALTLSFLSLLLVMKLPAALFGSFIKDSLNPALNSPVRNLIFTIFPKNIQGRIRAVSIGILLPLALISCSLILLLAQHYENSYYFLVPGLISGLLLILYSLRVNKQYVQTLVHHLKDQVYISEDTKSTKKDSDIENSFIRSVQNNDHELIIRYADSLLQNTPTKASEIILENISQSPKRTTEALITLIASHSSNPFKKIIHNNKLNDYNELSQAAILHILFNNKDTDSEEIIPELFHSKSPILCAAGIAGAFNYTNKKIINTAIQKWLELTESDNEQQLAALSLCKYLPDLNTDMSARININYMHIFSELLDSHTSTQQYAALDSLATWQTAINTDIQNKIQQLCFSADPDIRSKSVRCLRLLPASSFTLLLQFLDDGHASVRQQAINILICNDSNPDETAVKWISENNNYLTPRAQHSLLKHLIDSGLSFQTLDEIIKSKSTLARRYYDLKQLLRPLANKSAAFYLTYTTVNERIEQVIQLLLSALQQTHQQELVSVASAAISSKDPLLIASACDALKNLKNKNIAELFIDLLQDDFELKTNYILSFTSIASALDWCSQQDEWLHQCTAEALNNG